MSFIIIQYNRLCDTCTRHEIEKAYKALRLNGDVSINYYPDGSNNYNSKLLGASNKKPTLWIKRLKFGSDYSPYNRGASSIQNQNQKRLEIERENADKALSLNCGF